MLDFTLYRIIILLRFLHGLLSLFNPASLILAWDIDLSIANDLSLSLDMDRVFVGYVATVKGAEISKSLVA
jgi:hypothetical protein